MQLEGLVKAGVFDEFDNDRNKILTSIPKIIQKIKNIGDKENNQTSLFNVEENDNEVFEFLPTNTWSQKNFIRRIRSIGFYLTDHPLNEFKEIFSQLKINSFNQFYSNPNEGLVAGTIMSIQEKKSAKGIPYAIVKFSDKDAEFELSYLLKF